MRVKGSASADLDGPLHERVASRIEELVSTGSLGPGDRLPPQRQLARELRVSIGTLTKAVETLTERGLLRGEVGRGTFVTAARRVSVPAEQSGTIDLSINAPPRVIPPEVLAEAARRASRAALDLPNGGYPDLTGDPRQRATLSAWLTRTRVPTDPDELLMCVGAQQGIHLAFADLAERSRTIATEGATFTGAIAAAANLGMTLVPVAHDADGLIPDDLDRVLTRTATRIVYTTPVCQNPIGFETSNERRHKILSVCRRHGAIVVEDDIYGLYAARSSGTYKEMAPDAVYLVTSLSKCLTPLVRVGLLVPPAERRTRIATRMRAEVWGAPPLSIETACALIELGADRLAADALRAEAGERIALTRSALKRDDFPMPKGAPHVWLPMSLIEAERLVRRASDSGIRLTPPDATLVEGTTVTGVRICIMAPQEKPTLERALHAIRGIIEAPAEAIV